MVKIPKNTKLLRLITPLDLGKLQKLTYLMPLGQISNAYRVGVPLSQVAGRARWGATKPELLGVRLEAKEQGNDPMGLV
jgi:hypothetical protein